MNADTAKLIAQARNQAQWLLMSWTEPALARSTMQETSLQIARNLLDALARLEAAEAQRDTLAEALVRIERWCDGEGDEFGRMLARAALAGVAPPEEQHG